MATNTGGIKMKIRNNSSKYVSLLNGRDIAPRQTIYVTTTKGTELYNQIKNLERKGILQILTT